MISPISYKEIIAAKDLLAEYAEECSSPELGEISPQPELYEALEKSGGFQAFGCFEGDTLIGFACVLVYVLPHYGKLIATTESIFIAQKYRNGIQWDDLKNVIQSYAHARGCNAFLYSAPVGSRFDRLLSHSFARHTNNTYLVKL